MSIKINKSKIPVSFMTIDATLHNTAYRCAPYLKDLTKYLIYIDIQYIQDVQEKKN